jgi:rare lipoprotein A (peptidoglycan hydrolase)
MMSFTRKVTAGAGLWLALGLTGVFAYADDWYREQGVASYYGKGFHGVKPPMGHASLKMR